jgi:hypothetical protein
LIIEINYDYMALLLCLVFQFIQIFVLGLDDVMACYGSLGQWHILGGTEHPCTSGVPWGSMAFDPPPTDPHSHIFNRHRHQPEVNPGYFEMRSEIGVKGNCKKISHHHYYLLLLLSFAL